MAEDDNIILTADTKLSAPKSMAPPPMEKLSKNSIAQSRSPARMGDTTKNDPLLLSETETEVTRRLLQMPRLSIPMFASTLNRQRQLNFKPFLTTAIPGGAGAAGTPRAKAATADAMQRLQVSSTVGLYQFQRGVALPYMRKSLALSYEHVSLTKSLLALTVSMSQMLESKLEAIKLNTGAPESKKSSLTEDLIIAVRVRALNKIAERISDKAVDLAKQGYTAAKPHIDEHVLDPAMRNYRAYRDGSKTSREILDEAKVAARALYAKTTQARQSAYQSYKTTNTSTLVRNTLRRVFDMGGYVKSGFKSMDNTTAETSNKPEYKEIHIRESPTEMILRGSTAIANRSDRLYRLMESYFARQEKAAIKQIRDIPIERIQAVRDRGEAAAQRLRDKIKTSRDRSYEILKTSGGTGLNLINDVRKNSVSQVQAGVKQVAVRANSYDARRLELLQRLRDRKAMLTGALGGTLPASAPGASQVQQGPSWMSDILQYGAEAIVGKRVAGMAGSVGRGAWGAAKTVGRFALPVLAGAGKLGLMAGAAGLAAGGGLLRRVMGGIGKAGVTGGVEGAEMAASGTRVYAGKTAKNLGLKMGEDGKYVKDGTSWLGRMFGGGAGKVAAEGGAEVGGKLAGKEIAAMGAKTLGKKIPIFGAILGAGLAARNLANGDYVGAAGNLLSALVAIVPGVGTAASFAIDAALGVRTLAKQNETTTADGKNNKADEPSAFSKYMYGSDAQVSNGRVLEKTESGVLGRMWEKLFGSKEQITSDGQIVKDGQLGIVGKLRNGAATTLRFMSDSIFGQYNPDGSRIVGSSYIEQGQAAVSKYYGKGKSIIENTAAAMRTGVMQFGGFLFGDDEKKDIVSRTWDAMTSTLSDWNKSLTDMVANAWQTLKDAPQAAKDAAARLAQHVADTAAAVPGALNALDDATRTAGNRLVGGITGGVSNAWNYLVGGSTPSTPGNNLFQQAANNLDIKPGQTIVPLPADTPAKLPKLNPQTPNSAPPSNVTPFAAAQAAKQQAEMIEQSRIMRAAATRLGLNPDQVSGTMEAGLLTAIAGPDGASIDLYSSLSADDRAKVDAVRRLRQSSGSTSNIAEPTAIPAVTGSIPSAGNPTLQFGSSTPPITQAATPGYTTSTPSSGGGTGITPPPSNDNRSSVRPNAFSPISGPIAAGIPAATNGVAGSASGTPLSSPSPGSASVSVSEQIENLKRAMDAQGMTDPDMRAGMMAIVGGESGFKGKPEESYANTSAARIRSVFGSRIGGMTDQQIDQLKSNDEAFYNQVYGGAFGSRNLGNSQPGDGYKFRGRGDIQLTGRDNYIRYGKMLGVDLVNNPDLLNDPNISAQLSVAYMRDRYKGGGYEGMKQAVNPGGGALNGRKDQLYAQYIKTGEMSAPGTQTANANTPAPGVMPANVNTAGAGGDGMFQNVSFPGMGGGMQMASNTPSMIPSSDTITNGAFRTAAVTPTATDAMPTPAIYTPASSDGGGEGGANGVLRGLQAIVDAVTGMHSTMSTGGMMADTNSLLQAHLDRPNTVVAPVVNTGGGGRNQMPSNDLSFAKAIRVAGAAV